MSRDNNGKITAIETDVTKLNQIKSLLEKNVTAALKKNGAEEEKIPLGTLLGSEYLSGRGPSVSMKIVPVGALQTVSYTHLDVYKRQHGSLSPICSFRTGCFRMVWSLSP